MANIGFELTNGHTVTGPVEHWVAAIIQVLTATQTEEVFKLMEGRQEFQLVKPPHVITVPSIDSAEAFGRF